MFAVDYNILYFFYSDLKKINMILWEYGAIVHLHYVNNEVNIMASIIISVIWYMTFVTGILNHKHLVLNMYFYKRVCVYLKESG